MKYQPIEWTVTPGTIKFPERKIRVGAQELDVAVATRSDEKRIGMKYRQDWDNDGMLFVFFDDVDVAFNMVDVHVEASIAFYDEQGLCLAAQDMEPGDQTLIRSPLPFRYALEVPRGSVSLGGTLQFA